MSDEETSPADTDGRDPGAVRRRTILKGAVAAGVGAAVWTTPMIVDSLASPAAAFSVPSGCFFVAFNSNCAPTNQGTPCENIVGCTALPSVAACLSITCFADGSVTVTNQCGSRCRISGAQAKSGNVCIPPDSCTGAGCSCAGANGTCTGDTQSIHFNARSSPGYSQFSVFVTCD